MKDKLVIVTLACVSLLALALTVRVGIGLYDHEHPASTHVEPLPTLAQIGHGKVGFRLHGHGGAGVRLTP